MSATTRKTAAAAADAKPAITRKTAPANKAPARKAPAKRTSATEKPAQPKAAQTNGRPKVDAAEAKALGKRLVAARELGFSRDAIAGIVGLTAAKVWRIEDGRVQADEVKPVTVFLSDVESGKVKPPERQPSGASAGPSKAVLVKAILDLKDVNATERSAVIDDLITKIEGK